MKPKRVQLKAASWTMSVRHTFSLDLASFFQHSNENGNRFESGSIRVGIDTRNHYQMIQSLANPRGPREAWLIHQKVAAASLNENPSNPSNPSKRPSNRHYRRQFDFIPWWRWHHSGTRCFHIDAATTTDNLVGLASV